MNRTTYSSETVSLPLNPVIWNAPKKGPALTPYYSDLPLGTYQPLDLMGMNMERPDPTAPYEVVVWRDGRLTLRPSGDDELGDLLTAGKVRFWFGYDNSLKDDEIMTLAVARDILKLARRAWHQQHVGPLG